MAYPAGAESRHTLVCGAGSADRRALLLDLVEQLRSRGERCVIHDTTGEYTQALFDPGRDVLLNPLDARAPRWSPLLEARDARDFTAMAAALAPRHAHPLQRIRAEAARRVFARGASRLWRDGVTDNGALVRYLLRTDVLEQSGTLKRAFGWLGLDPADPKNATSVRAILSDMAGALEVLPDGGRQFSIRDWVQSDSEGGWLFLSSQGGGYARLRGLTAAWLEAAIDALHWRGWRNSARVWVIVDDIAAVNAVPGLKAALAGGPSFGGRVVLGMPTLSALREVYGERDADAIADACATRVVLRVGDATAAMRCAQWLGRLQTGSPGGGAADGAAHRGAASPGSEERARWIVPPHEIQSLDHGEGYLKFPGPWPVGRFRIRGRKRRRRAAPRFVARRPARSGGPGDGPNGGNDHRPGETRDRGLPETPPGNRRSNGKAPGQVNWC